MAYCEVCKEAMLTEWPHVHWPKPAPAKPPVEETLNEIVQRVLFIHLGFTPDIEILPKATLDAMCAVAAKMIEMVEAHKCHVSANDECSCKSHIAAALREWAGSGKCK